MVSEALFSRGAWVKALLPPDVIRETILSAGTENYSQLETRIANKNLSILADPITDPKLGISVSDNPNWVMLNEAARQHRSKRFESRLTAGIEGAYTGMYSRRVRITPPDSLETVNYVIDRKIPNDCVLPLTEPGNPRDPLGYYVMLDERGRPISRIRNINHLEQLSNMASASKSVSTTVKNVANNFGFNDRFSGVLENDARLLLDDYIRQVERSLKESFAGKGEEETIDIPRIDEIYSLMFARALSNKMTRVIFLDRSLVVYAAYDYSEYGIGVSKLEQTKLISSIRVSLLFAEFYRSIKNAMGLTKLNLQLDDNDPDYVNTVQRTLALYNAMRNNTTPIAYNTPDQVMASLHQSSTLVSIDGGNAFPNTKLDIVEEQRQNNVGDNSFEEQLRISQYNRIGIPPEYMDQALQGDFAVGITTTNKLFAMRVKQWQEITENFGTEYIQKHVRWNGRLMKEIVDLIEDAEEKKNFDMGQFISGLYMKLPEPDTTRIQAHAEAYSQMRTFVAEVIEDFINEDFYEGILEGENLGNVIRSMKTQLISAIMRDWMNEQSILPEVGRMLDLENNVKFYEKVIDHMEILAGNFTEILKVSGLKEYTFDKQINKAKRKLEAKKAADEEKLNAEENPDDGSDDADGGYDDGEADATGDSDGTTEEGSDVDNFDEDPGSDTADEDSQSSEEEPTEESVEETEPEAEEPAEEEEPEAEPVEAEPSFEEPAEEAPVEEEPVPEEDNAEEADAEEEPESDKDEEETEESDEKEEDEESDSEKDKK